MLLSKVFERFAQKSPVSVMVRGLLEHALAPEFLDELFERTARTQYTRELLFSTTVDLMSHVVCGVRKSVHAAYQASAEEIAVSTTALYDKLAGIEPQVSRALVRETAERLRPVQRELGGCLPPLLPGFRTKILDGNCLAATEHRLKELRDTASGPLPGKSLVVLDPACMLATDVFPCEDGHAQERSLLDEVLETVEPCDLWIADRNFCTVRFVLGIWLRRGFFAIRRHGQFPGGPQGRKLHKKRIDGGTVFERSYRFFNEEGEPYFLRQITVRFDEPTRDGETEIHILTNLPREEADAAKVAELYHQRWTVETAFQTLTETLACEINTLGYPRAALFAFCVALVAYNALSIVRGALRSVHGSELIEQEVSTYYLADEIAGTYRGMMIALPPEKWHGFRTATPVELAACLKDLAARVKLSAFRKHPRGPKKPRAQRQSAKGQPHVATARLLNKRKRKRSP
jgi:hypothetical protein